MFNFDTTYLQLPERCYARLEPTPVARPGLIAFNLGLARELGVDTDGWSADALAAMFSGNAMPEGATPLAMAYAGHQFGSFVPQLGDGRALLLGEVVDRDGRRRDIQLKGAGITPFSRGGDGRAALGPVLREYLLSEAMHALNIPTTRALAAVLTGEPVMRDTALPGAVLTRVAASHVRVGTFQYFAARRDTEALQHLVDHVIARHYPAAAQAEVPSIALVEAVLDAQARLVARWLEVGFIHGVMNTDNMSVAGETIDYGPCAFMDAYAPGTVFSSIDRRGRYAYMNQPPIAAWNLARFAETLLPLVDADPEAAVARLTEVVSGFAGRFEHHWLSGMRAKLGLGTARAEDAALVQGFLDVLQAAAADYTLSFRALCDAVEEPGAATEGELHRSLGDAPGYADWLGRWQARLDGEPRSRRGRATAMRAVNPLFIPRNHLVEEALAAALERSDFVPFERLLTVLGRPFDAQPDAADLAAAPPPSDTPYRTFCGT